MGKTNSTGHNGGDGLGDLWVLGQLIVCPPSEDRVFKTKIEGKLV